MMSTTISSLSPSVLLILLLTTQQAVLFTSARIIDHGTFSVMVDDLDISRPRPSNPDDILTPAIPSTTSTTGALSSPTAPLSSDSTSTPSLTQSGSAVAPTGSAVAPTLAQSGSASAPTLTQSGSAVAPTLTQSGSAAVAPQSGSAAASSQSDPILSMMSSSSVPPVNDSASSILAAIRSANGVSDLQPGKPDPLSSTPASRSYLSGGARSPDRRPSAISIIEEELLVVPVEGGQAAVAYELTAVDQYGHRFHTGARTLIPGPGLRPVLPIVGVPAPGSVGNWAMFPSATNGQLVQQQPSAVLRQQQSLEQSDLERQLHLLLQNQSTGQDSIQPQQPGLLRQEQSDLERQLQLLLVENQSTGQDSTQPQQLSESDAVLQLLQQQQQQQQGQDQVDLDRNGLSGSGVSAQTQQTSISDDGEGVSQPSTSSSGQGWMRTPSSGAGVPAQPATSPDGDGVGVSQPSSPSSIGQFWIRTPSAGVPAQSGTGPDGDGATVPQPSSGTGQGWVRTPSSGSGQGPSPVLRRSDGRHFVQIHDDDDDDDTPSWSPAFGKHGTQHPHPDHDDDHRGEHKKPERRRPIRKAPEEWRCLETSLDSTSDRIEKLVCPPGLMITSFGLASLGDPEGSCTGPGDRRPGPCHVDLAPTLQAACLGKAVCDLVAVSAANQSATCGGRTGPARAMVEYECSPWVSQPSNATPAERCQQVQTNGTLQCPDGQAILGFGFGFYGEIDGSCAKGISPGICSRNVMTDLTAQCVGKNQCRIENVNSTKQFGSACSNSTSAISLAASFKCGSFAEAAAANASKTSGGNMSYPSGSLQFATATKGNGASATQSGLMALMIVMGIMTLVI